MNERMNELGERTNGQQREDGRDDWIDEWLKE